MQFSVHSVLNYSWFKIQLLTDEFSPSHMLLRQLQAVRPVPSL